MFARDKFTSLKFKNKPRVIYDNDWIPGVEYKNEDYSEENQEDKVYTDRKMIKMNIKMNIYRLNKR